MAESTTGILAEVITERASQDDQWGEQNHLPSKWMLILMEEVGEASKEVLEAYALGDGVGLIEPLEKWRAELIQVAAVAVAAVECYDRNKEFI
jgi:NTP pyrophosphatase (non-canonical NTP hydrolase)